MFGGSFMNSWFDMNLSGHSGFQERLDILKAANVSYELVDITYILQRRQIRMVRGCEKFLPAVA